MQKLTRREAELLGFIEATIADTGIAPSHDEMCVALGVATKVITHRLVDALVAKGRLRRLPRRARALEVVRMPPSTSDPYAFVASLKVSPPLAVRHAWSDDLKLATWPPRTREGRSSGGERRDVAAVAGGSIPGGRP